ncbi:MAG: hypothetical protein GXY40_07790 [Syntrophomonadaceae bacterium]|nr:hypothetical protein [Syntrophomonadaceae bacterium]
MPGYCVLRYYFYLDDEDDKLQGLLKTVQNSIPLKLYNPHNYGEILPSTLYYEMEFNNVRILVLGLNGNHSTWNESLQLLSSWEEQTGINADVLLGQASVLCGYGYEWEVLLEEVSRIEPIKELIPAVIDRGQIARIFDSRVRGETYFLCRLEEYTGLNRRLLLEGLPQLQAALIKLQMIISLLRDRHQTIVREKEELNQKLSQILHAHLVTEQSSSEESAQLEQQINELSASYGMIAGDYALLSTDCKKIEVLLSDLNRQFRIQPGLKLDDEFRDNITQPYYRRLQEMLDTLDELRISRENHQAAIEVVRSKVDILNSRANIATQEQIKDLMEVNTEMQKQSLVFQYAAGLIEFIVLAYYSHSLWSHLAHNAYAAIPGWIQFIVVMVFSGSTVYCTHLLAEYIQGEHHVRRKLIYSGIFLLALFVFVLVTTLLLGAKSPAH